jgi:hypothetical protein
MTNRFHIVTLGLFIAVIATAGEVYGQDAQSASVNPHGNLSIDISCSDCHTSESWVPAKEVMDFNHDTQTTFALIGKHALTNCENCHLDLKFTEPTIIGEGCESCHVDVHQGEFSQQCSDCHNQENFADVDGIFIHNRTTFQLTGAHLQIECETCHVDQSMGHFTNLETECIDCHQEEYELAETVDHVESGFPLTCDDCHTTLAWQPAFFDHLTASDGFALIGAHSLVDCASCHILPSMDLVFNAASDQDCYACHMDDYLAEHQGSGFPTNCLACHSVNSWDDADFEHTEVSNGFELLGAHSKVDCDGCHSPGFGLVFSPPPEDQNDCYSCHTNDYEEEHGGSGFPTDCTLCHNVNDWDDAEEFDHASLSGGFELLGAHSTEVCSSCHTPDLGLVFNPPPSDQNDCFTCHADDYEEEHGGTGFPTDCLSCHNVNNWDDADEFDHASLSGGFELLGAHSTEDCSSCHTPDFELVFSPSPVDQNDCYTCHTDDYEEEHAVAGFPTDCLSCHTLDNWERGPFEEHDALYFPIFSGAHSGEWESDCRTCHITPVDFSLFECINCHEHERSQTDDDHSELSGYIYESTACYSCHPSGRSDD